MSCYSGDIDTGSECTSTGCRTVSSCTYGESYTHYFTRCLAVNNNYAIYCNYVKTTTGPCCSKP